MSEPCKPWNVHRVLTKKHSFADKYPDGSTSYGGYADYHRAPSHFVFKIPNGIPPEEAAVSRIHYPEYRLTTNLSFSLCFAVESQSTVL